MSESSRFVNLTDLFEIKCKRCGSTDVDLSPNSCGECGDYIEANCNNCNLRYDYHSFLNINVVYDKKGHEVSNNLDLIKL